MAKKDTIKIIATTVVTAVTLAGVEVIIPEGGKELLRVAEGGAGTALAGLAFMAIKRKNRSE